MTEREELAKWFFMHGPIGRTGGDFECFKIENPKSYERCLYRADEILALLQPYLDQQIKEAVEKERCAWVKTLKLYAGASEPVNIPEHRYGPRPYKQIPTWIFSIPDSVWQSLKGELK